MRNATIYTRGSKLYVSFYLHGRRHQISSGFVVGEEREAEAALRDLQARCRAEETVPAKLLTLAAYVETWISKRTNKTASDEATRLRKHVVAVFGERALSSLARPELEHFFDKVLPLTIAGSRTRRHVFNDLRRVYKDAQLEGLIGANPTDGIKPPARRDKDPLWRKRAVFEPGEVAQLISDMRIPLLRRVYYGLAFLGGMRTGEVAALRWGDRTKRDPFDAILICRSYSTRRREIGVLKTKTDDGMLVRETPVAPLLHELLSSWRVEWRALFGREPTDDDLLVPKPLTKGRGRRVGGAQVCWRNDAILELLGVDCRLLGLRRRTIHDARATFLTISEEVGCSALLRLITHAPVKGVHQGYVRRTPWKPLCDDIRLIDARVGSFMSGTNLKTA